MLRRFVDPPFRLECPDTGFESLISASLGTELTCLLCFYKASLSFRGGSMLLSLRSIIFLCELMAALGVCSGWVEPKLIADSFGLNFRYSSMIISLLSRMASLGWLD